MDQPAHGFGKLEQSDRVCGERQSVPAVDGCFDAESQSIADLTGFKGRLAELAPEELGELLALIKSATTAARDRE